MSLSAINLNGGAANVGSGSSVDPASTIGLSRSQGKINIEGAGKPIEDGVEISSEAEALFGEEASEKTGKPGEAKEKDDEASSDDELSEEEQDLVDRLKKRDAEVRAHEQAHLRAAGSYAKGGAHYEFQAGPDGKRYAVGGHVNIDVGKERDPETTLAKAEQVKRAALAPAEPSSTDRQVAAKADQLKAEARAELQEEARLESEGKIEEGESVEDADTSEEPEAADENSFQADEDAPEVKVPDSLPKAGTFDGLSGLGQGDDSPRSGTVGKFDNPYENKANGGLIGQGISLIA